MQIDVTRFVEQLSYCEAGFDVKNIAAAYQEDQKQREIINLGGFCAKPRKTPDEDVHFFQFACQHRYRRKD